MDSNRIIKLFLDRIQAALPEVVDKPTPEQIKQGWESVASLDMILAYVEDNEVAIDASILQQTKEVLEQFRKFLSEAEA